MNNKDKNWKRKFIAYLKENGLYGKWIYNLKDQHPTTNGRLWCMLLDSIYKNKSYEGINHAFNWANTKDGHEFWRFYDIEWKRIVRNGDIQKMF